MAKVRKRDLSKLLVRRGLLKEEKLEEILEERRRTGKELKDLLIERDLISERELAELLAQELEIPFVDLNNYLIDPSVMQNVPESIARKHKLIPLFKVRQTLTVAMSDPLNVVALDEVKLRSSLSIQPVISTESGILQAIDQYYTVSDSVDEIIRGLEKRGLEFGREEEFDLLRLQRMAEEPPVVKLVNLLISQAIKDKASDIHIEPEEEKVRVRFRIDGVLQELTSLPRRLQLPIIPRIKVIASLDIVERRKPQDGRFRVKLEGRDIDLRISTFPVAFGEKVVMRILDRTTAFLSLEELGFSPEYLRGLEKAISSPHGIILITGPTGSGKTSTLYTILNKLNSPDKNIVTLEDPREYLLKGINQGQVNPEVGVTFATGLRHILRQDPDIIMVGEIRDLETAEIAIRAALTGHLVLSTLHTNDAPGALTRLLDMGVEPFLISSSLVAVLAQRLVRTICPSCRKEYRPSKEVLERLELKTVTTLYEGKGCIHCRQTGYKGRVGIFELMVLNDGIRDLIMRRSPKSMVAKVAKKAGMRTLRESGMEKVLQGITTIEEVARATQEVE